MPVRSLKAAAPVSSATSSTSLQSFWTAPALPRPPPDDGAEAAATEAMAVASVAESGKERFCLRSLLREGAAEPWSAARSRRELGLGFGERRRSWERPRDLEREVRFLERGVEARGGSGGGGGFIHGVRGRPLGGHRRCGGEGSPPLRPRLAAARTATGATSSRGTRGSGKHFSPTSHIYSTHPVETINHKLFYN